ncbi:MAG TPA: aldo/keto reductase [Steroidobacteraceae bacterium]|jgi:D-threo-aldose 1-dehydrogenase|nr:aldo/keto reductase [Steroidobacteraceae bacterium]
MAIERSLLSRRRRIGSTLLELPAFGLGTAHLGELYSKVDEQDARATLDTAWSSGIRYYDTAPWYGRGLSDHRVGGFLRTKPRSEFYLTTKLGRTLRRPKNPLTFDRSPWVGGLNFDVKFDYSYDGFMRSYEQALQRMGIDTVDALLVHDLDEAQHGERYKDHLAALVESGMRALEELKASGDIKAVGMGINTGHALETTAAMVELDFVLVAMPYTLLDQSSLHTGLAACAARGISVIIGAPFASGILATGPGDNARYSYSAAPAEVQAKVAALQAVCREHGVSLSAAALQFPLAHPSVVSIIPGAVRSSEITQNIAALSSAVPEAFWTALKSKGLIDPAAPTPSPA